MPFSLSTTLDLKAPARERLIVSLLAVLMLSIRLFLMRDGLHDSYAAALAETANKYEPGTGFPPFPGNPVYVLLIRFFIFLGFADYHALSLPSIVSCSIAVFPMFNIAKRIFGIREAYAAALMYALHPGILSFSLLPGSDAVLLFPLLLGVRLTLRTAFISREEREKTRFISQYAGSAVLALSIGLSGKAFLLLLIPLSLAVLSAIKLKSFSAITETFNGCLIGLFLWALPYLMNYSISDLLLHTSAIDPLFETSHSTLAEKAKSLLWGVTVYSHSISESSAPTFIITILLLILFLRGLIRSFSSRGFTHLAIPIVTLLIYGFASNIPDAPANYSLLFPFMILIASGGVIYRPFISAKNTGAIIIALVVIVIFTMRANMIKNGRTKMEQAIAYLREICPEGDCTIFCGVSTKLIKRELTYSKTYQIDSYLKLKNSNLANESVSGTALYLSDIPGFKKTLIAKENPAIEIKPLPLLEGRKPALQIFKDSSR